MAQREYDPGDTMATAEASSVGRAVWPPEEATEQRKKGILNRVLETADDLSSIITEFQNMPFDEATTRYTARIFVTDSLLKRKDIKAAICEYVEAILPLASCGIPDLEDCCMVYIGKNADTRKADPQELQHQLKFAKEVYSGESASKEKNSVNGYRIEQVADEMKKDANLQHQYAELYQAFGWNEDQVVELLTNHSNTLVAAFDGDRLISAGMAERAELTIERNSRLLPFVMYEVTEAATVEEYRGKGLYTSVAKKIMRILANGDANIVYAESNLSAPGVLLAGQRQGRRSAVQSAELFGYPPRSLEQHVRISGGSHDQRPPQEKNNLIVTWMTQSEVQRVYGNQTTA